MIMRRCALPIVIASTLAIAAACTARAQQAFTKDEMDDAKVAAGQGAEGWDIETIVQVPPSYVEVLESKGGVGWRVADLKLVKGKFIQEWSSPPFNLQSIDMASKDDFKLVQTKKFVGVSFQGCPPHLCDDHVGIYLHVAGQHQGFEVDVAGNDVTYSANVWEPRNRIYLAWLGDQVNSLPWLAPKTAQ